MERVGAGQRLAAFLLDILIAAVLIALITTTVATVGGVRLGMRYQELLGGGVSISRVLDGSVEDYVEERVEEVSDRIVARVSEDFTPEAIDRMAEIMAEELIARFEPRWDHLRFYLHIDETTLPTAVDEAFDAVIARDDPQLPGPQVNALRDEVQAAIRQLRLDEFLPSVVAFGVLVAGTPIAVLILYFFIEAFAGASVGKLSIGLAVGTTRGDKAYMGTAIYRFLVKFAGPVLVLLGVVLRSYPLVPIGGVVTGIMLVGTLTILGPDRRCLHDYLSGTAVYRRGDLSE